MIEGISDNNVVFIDSYNIGNTFNDSTMYIDKDYDTVMKKICDNMEFQYKKYVDDGYTNKNLKSTRHITVILAGFSKIMVRINDEIKKRFFELLKSVKDIEQFTYIFVDRVDNLKKLEYDEWYKKVIQNNYGIWIGNGVADQNLIKTNIGFKKVNNEIPDGYGIVIKNTKTSLVKLISDNGIDEKSDGEKL